MYNSAVFALHRQIFGTGKTANLNLATKSPILKSGLAGYFHSSACMPARMVDINQDFCHVPG